MSTASENRYVKGAITTLGAHSYVTVTAPLTDRDGTAVAPEVVSVDQGCAWEISGNNVIIKNPHGTAKSGVRYIVSNPHSVIRSSSETDLSAIAGPGTALGAGDTEIIVGAISFPQASDIAAVSNAGDVIPLADTTSGSLPVVSIDTANDRFTLGAAGTYIVEFKTTVGHNAADAFTLLLRQDPAGTPATVDTCIVENPAAAAFDALLHVKAVISLTAAQIDGNTNVFDFLISSDNGAGGGVVEADTGKVYIQKVG